jgi:hypothetical protein
MRDPTPTVKYLIEFWSTTSCRYPNEILSCLDTRGDPDLQTVTRKALIIPFDIHPEHSSLKHWRSDTLDCYSLAPKAIRHS